MHALLWGCPPVHIRIEASTVPGTARLPWRMVPESVVLYPAALSALAVSVTDPADAKVPLMKPAACSRALAASGRKDQNRWNTWVLIG